MSQEGIEAEDLSLFLLYWDVVSRRCRFVLALCSSVACSLVRGRWLSISTATPVTDVEEEAAKLLDYHLLLHSNRQHNHAFRRAATIHFATSVARGFDFSSVCVVLELNRPVREICVGQTC